MPEALELKWMLLPFLPCLLLSINHVYLGLHVIARKVIFLDLKLPKIDGIEVLRRVRVDDRLRSIPVVVLTSSHEERDISECYKLGVNSYIVKPVEFDHFYKAIGDLVTYWLVLNKSPL